MKIIWSEPALTDIENIKDYIAKDSEFYATEFAEEVFEMVNNLAHFPSLGKMVFELQNKKVREMLHHNYRIIYRINDVNVIVLAIVHGARDLRKLKTNL